MPTPAAPRLKLVPASQGVQWARQGFRVFARKPLGFAVLLGAVMLYMLITNLVPLVGSIVWLMSMPIASLGFMLAGEAATRDRLSTPAVFIDPLRQSPAQKAAQIKLGGLYAGAFVLIVVVSQLILGDAAAEVTTAMTGSGPVDQQAALKLLGDPRLRWAWGTMFGLLTLLNLAFWHAPALVHWAGQPAAKALFFSWIACWRNRGAFVVYGLAWTAVLIGGLMLTGVLLGLLGGGKAVSVLLLPVSLLIVSAFYASLYFTFADCFEFDHKLDLLA